MAFDGMFTHAMVTELKKLILNGRIVKISQPYPNEVILTLRNNHQNYPLLLSAHPNYARIQITQIPYQNPATPTKFTMMLRKYLENAKLTAINQLENDRVIYLSFETRNEIGDRQTLLLSIEIMNRYSNVILINHQTQKIIDTIKHVGLDQNRYRTLLPGAQYRRPPKQSRLNPFDKQNIQSLIQLKNQFPNREVLAQNLQQTFQGFGTLSALQLADTLHQNDNRTPQEHLESFLYDANHPTPCLTSTQHLDYTFTALGQGIINKRPQYNSLSSLLDYFYREKATRERVREQGTRLIRVVHQELKKNRKKLKKQQIEYDNTQYADEYRIQGELLTTYLSKIKRGMNSITLPNFYDNNKPIKIVLSNQLGPSQNAQKYFKKYQKLKNAITYLKKQIKLTKDEIEYFEGIQSQIELAEPQDLVDIQTELENGGYLRKNNHHKKRKRQTKVNRPETFWSSDGTKIQVGKNNLQNEKLTLHLAAKTDYWLHVKNLPGSHVIVDSNHPSKETLIEAAELAAYFSKSRNSANVPVDYVQVKKIRKPNGTKPGFVIYEGQRTLYVTPSIEKVQSLKNKN